MRFCVFGADSISLPWVEVVRPFLKKEGVETVFRFEKATASTKGVVSIDDGKNLLSSVDALIVACDHPTGEVNYLIASAVSNNKPLLCFVANANGIPDNLQSFLKDYQNYGKTILDIKSFSSIGIDNDLRSFVDKVKNILQSGRPSIKFTLRITASIDEYITKKSKETGLSKADWVRLLITSKMDGVR